MESIVAFDVYKHCMLFMACLLACYQCSCYKCRTVHTAQSPNSVKWVTQVWIAGGHPRTRPGQDVSTVTSISSGPVASSASSSSSAPASSSAAAGTDDDVEGRILSTR